MSLNKTLDRLFDEIRREARRNPAFADRLDVVMRAHASRRNGAELEEVVDDEASLSGSAPADEVIAQGCSIGEDAQPDSDLNAAGDDVVLALSLNPVGVYQREGEAALCAALQGFSVRALAALVREHNLDPSGEATGLEQDDLAAHIVAQAKRRAERDRRLFDY